ncbi:hypothetical protein AV530_003333 [Patagioenas fasciata monilis]|uniref:Uncharacterized protein n=1 Tax=Patagioenas fasciata monilis TaxID=372326 RepID=A0A1V4K2C0_PATFA|nr:hypothetical protein AV530_003333 [Patagioenas fasciata monilis]
MSHAKAARRDFPALIVSGAGVASAGSQPGRGRRVSGYCIISESQASRECRLMHVHGAGSPSSCAAIRRKPPFPSGAFADITCGRILLFACVSGIEMFV